MDKIEIPSTSNYTWRSILKLSVSIVICSPVSFMIHAGVNISSGDTPVKTKGLSDYGIDEYVFAEIILDRFAGEMAGARSARCKVRGVK